MGPAAGAISVVSGIYGIYSGIQQSKEASKAAADTEEQSRREAAFIESQTRKEASRFRDAADEALADNRARAAASGTAAGGSQSIFGAREEDKFAQELDWLIKAGGSRADLAVERGSTAADVLESQGDTALWSGVTSGVGQIGGGVDDLNARYNWW